MVKIEHNKRRNVFLLLERLQLMSDHHSVIQKQMKKRRRKRRKKRRKRRKRKRRKKRRKRRKMKKMRTRIQRTKSLMMLINSSNK